MVYIMYIDESGDTIPLSQNGKKFLVLTGCIIKAEDKTAIEQELRNIKSKYYQNPDIEIKSNFLRYANPDITACNSPLKLHDRKKYDQLEAEVSSFLKKIPVALISVAIDKPAFWNKYPSKNPYDSAYIFLLEHYQMFLEREKALGICILDPREGQVEKHYIGESIDKAHHSLRFDNDRLGIKCTNVIERVLFSTSDLNIGIQIADLYCYPIFHVLEYNKKGSDYWRYNDITKGKIDNIGIKNFPEESKKDLHLFD